MRACGADSSGRSGPRALVVGHLTEDLTPEGPRLGGAAAFAALLVHRFGAAVTILTSADARFPFLDLLAGIRILRVASVGRTRFENRYRADGTREQRLLSRAAPIPEVDIARAVAALEPGSAVLYAPVANELEGLGPLPRPRGPGGFAAAAPQGLLRRWDAEGRVSVSWPPRLDDRLAGLDLVSLAAGEMPEARTLRVPVLAITRGRRGALLRRSGLPDALAPPIPASEADPTGAGDVFAAALFVSLWRGLRVEKGARLAAAAAAISVESPGTTGIPTLEEAVARALSG